ncbi:YdcF family protein [Acinetobacter terrestris]|uniref:YdcF family protein n=1 Tax=Acinetobacter terrestris TaxID=2529843 RepID=A0AAW6UWD5_9GAMM|nr:YdcF family protein [Acinetobacter terrestris]MDK1684080.1 YdcF family protein [Acinetobacter terrestris]NNH35888.1 YdcF family protein [Acinetobacter terrestris]
MSEHLKRSFSFIIGSLLALDGLWLLSLDKIHLGIILPVIIGIGFILYSIFYNFIQLVINKNKRRLNLWRCAWAAFFLWLGTLLIFFAYLQYTIQQNTEAQPAAAIIVLGSGIENGQPSPTLKQRLDVAATYAKRYPQTIMLMTGGLGFKEQMTEAEVMSEYLQKHHQIDQTRILLEDQSTSTEQNLRNVQPLLKAHHITLSEPIIIATSDFHLLRAKAIAKHQGYQQILTISAPTPLYIRYNSWLREYFAFISGWLLNEY